MADHDDLSFSDFIGRLINQEFHRRLHGQFNHDEEE